MCEILKLSQRLGHMCSCKFRDFRDPRRLDRRWSVFRNFGIFKIAEIFDNYLETRITKIPNSFKRQTQTISGSRVSPDKTRGRSWKYNQATPVNSYLSREGPSCISPVSSPRSLPAWSWPRDTPSGRPTCLSCWGRTGPSSPPIARWLFVGYLRQCSYLLVIEMRQAFFRIRSGTIDRPDRSFHRTSIV